MNYSLSLQSMVILPPNFLDSDASIGYVHQAHHASTTKAPFLSRHVRVHTYIKHKRWRFWYPFSFESTGVSIIKKPKHFYLQNLKNLLYHSKILQDGLCDAMCTFVHFSMHMRMSVIKMCKVCICMPWVM